MPDARNPCHSLTTDGEEPGSQTVPSEGSETEILSTRVPNGFFRSRYDQDLSEVKCMFEFDPCDKSYTPNKFFSPPSENGEQITIRAPTPNFTLTEKLKGSKPIP